MAKKLIWQSFETYEEMEAAGDAFFQSLTPAARIARFLAVFAARQALGIPPKQPDADAYVLKKRDDSTT